MLDLTPMQIRIVREILARYLPGTAVWVFGSRVDGTASRGSDLDLVAMTKEPLSIEVLGRLRGAFSESDLPFRVDIVDWSAINDDFREVIEANREQVQ